MSQCECGSYAINHNCHGRDGSDGHLCDVCYWRTRANDGLEFTKLFLDSWESEVKWFTNCYMVESEAIRIIKKNKQEES